MQLKESIKLLTGITSYNLKIIFSGKFIYFLLAALLFFFVITGIMLFQDEAADVHDVYGMLLFSGMLIIFYPVVFNIQNDKDTRMLEILFGVPDYRYKVYLLRFVMSLLLLIFLLFMLSVLSWFSVVQIPVFRMVLQLMSPLFFLACLTFMLTTLIRNANGAAVVVIIISLLFFMMSEPLARSKWNLFLNPFNIPMNMNLSVWMNVVHQNRLILGIASVIALLWALMNLQQREKFV